MRDCDGVSSYALLLAPAALSKEMPVATHSRWPSRGKVCSSRLCTVVGQP